MQMKCGLNVCKWRLEKDIYLVHDLNELFNCENTDNKYIADFYGKFEIAQNRLEYIKYW